MIVVAVLTAAVYHKHLLFSPAAREGYAVLLRKHVSRNSAGKGRAVLEGVGLTPERIGMHFSNNPRNEEEAVQSGLTEWSGGRYSNPTWRVLLGAMDYAGIGCQLIDSLKAELLNKTGRCVAYSIITQGSHDISLDMPCVSFYVTCGGDLCVCVCTCGCVCGPG